MSPSLGPAKAVSTGIFGATSVLIVWLAQQFGVTVPAEVAAAFTTVLATAATWFTPTTVD